MDESFKKIDDNLKKNDTEEIRRKLMKKSINIQDLIKDKYFQTALGSYCLYTQACEPLNLDEYVKKQIQQFSHNTDLIRAFLEYMNENQAAAGFSRSSSTFDMNLAGKQLSSGANSRRK